MSETIMNTYFNGQKVEDCEAKVCTYMLEFRFETKVFFPGDEAPSVFISHDITEASKGHTFFEKMIVGLLITPKIHRVSGLAVENLARRNEIEDE